MITGKGNVEGKWIQWIVDESLERLVDLRMGIEEKW